MARPREFDESEVLDRALTTFWSLGYEATSIEALSEATGLGRASLYGAFGAKDALFLRVVDHYLAEASRQEAASIAGARSVPDALRTLIGGWVAGMCPKQGPRGCFLSVAGTTGGSAELVGEILQRETSGRRTMLEALIARGQASGELASTSSPATLAQFLIVMQQGLSTSARGGMKRKDLEAAVDEALAHVIGRR